MSLISTIARLAAAAAAVGSAIYLLVRWSRSVTIKGDNG